MSHWGGPTGRRNNPDAEDNMAALLAAWREAGNRVFYTQHDSREATSPLKLSEAGGTWKPCLEPKETETVITRDVNSGFIGTNLEIDLRRAGIQRLLIVGFFTNMCVETTTRMAGNMGFDTYLAHDACATTNRIGLDGTDRDSQLVHDMTVANLHGEFCTALSSKQALGLLKSDDQNLRRAQGNE